MTRFRTALSALLPALVLNAATDASASEHPCFDDLAQLVHPGAARDPRPKGGLSVPWIEWVPAVMPYNRPSILPMLLTVRIEGAPPARSSPCPMAAACCRCATTAWRRTQRPAISCSARTCRCRRSSTATPRIAGTSRLSDRCGLSRTVCPRAARSIFTSAFGTRNPAAAAALKRFKVLTVVASSGRTLDTTDLRWLSYMALRAQSPGTRRFSEGFVASSGPNFNAASGGVVALDCLLNSIFSGGFEGGP